MATIILLASSMKHLPKYQFLWESLCITILHESMDAAIAFSLLTYTMERGLCSFSFALCEFTCTERTGLEPSNTFNYRQKSFTAV